MNTADNVREAADNIADDTRSLIHATADAADEKVVQAKNRLSAALDAAQDTCAAVQKKVAERAKAVDQAIQNKPYQAMTIAFGVGILVGVFWTRRNRD